MNIGNPKKLVQIDWEQTYDPKSPYYIDNRLESGIYGF